MCSALASKWQDEGQVWRKIVEALEELGVQNVANRIRNNNNYQIFFQVMDQENHDIFQIPKTKCRKCVLLSLILSMLLSISLIAIILGSLHYQKVFTPPPSHEASGEIDYPQNYAGNFTIFAGDTVVVPNKHYPEYEAINVIISPVTPRNSHKINLYKVSQALHAKTTPIDSGILEITDKTCRDCCLLDKRYVLNGSHLNISMNLTDFNGKSEIPATNTQCHLTLFIFDNHIDYHKYKCSDDTLPSRTMCITGHGIPQTFLDDSLSQYVITALKTSLDVNITYRITGMQRQYNATDYPVYCSIDSRSDHCNVTIMQSQDMILALTDGSDLDLHYKISVYFEVVTNQLLHIFLWIVATVSLACTACGLFCYIGHNKWYQSRRN